MSFSKILKALKNPEIFDMSIAMNKTITMLESITRRFDLTEGTISKIEDKVIAKTLKEGEREL